MNLNIVGIGVVELEQVTLEGLRVMQESELVIAFQISEICMIEFCQKYNLKKVEHIDFLYKNDTKDNVNYENIYNHIVDRLNEYKKITLLIQGHPLLGVTLSQRLTKLSSIGICIKLIAAPSSFDNILIDNCRDPLELGSVIIDANRLLLFRINLNPNLDTYIYHVCSVGTSKTSYQEPWVSNRIDLLEQYLLKFYSMNTEVQLIYSNNNIASDKNKHQRTQKIQFKLRDFQTKIRTIHYGMTLFIPGILSNNYNKQFLELLKGNINAGL